MMLFALQLGLLYHPRLAGTGVGLHVATSPTFALMCYMSWMILEIEQGTLASRFLFVHVFFYYGRGVSKVLLSGEIGTGYKIPRVIITHVNFNERSAR